MASKLVIVESWTIAIFLHSTKITENDHVVKNGLGQLLLVQKGIHQIMMFFCKLLMLFC